MADEHPQAAPAAAGPGPGSVAKEEAARQLVMIAGGLVLIIAAAWAERYFTSPDAHAMMAARLGRARQAAPGRAWKAAERSAATVAARAWKVAEAARVQHERATSS